jgi:hypothetical protein
MSEFADVWQWFTAFYNYLCIITRLYRLYKLCGNILEDISKQIAHSDLEGERESSACT